MKTNISHTNYRLTLGKDETSRRKNLIFSTIFISWIKNPSSITIISVVDVGQLIVNYRIQYNINCLSSFTEHTLLIFVFQSDMISIDIDGPSTMLDSICESIVITQGSVYSNTVPKCSTDKPIIQPVPKNIFDDNRLPSPSSHVVVEQQGGYLPDGSRALTQSTKKEKIEVIDTWRDRTVIDGSSAIWRSPPLQNYKATKHIQPSNKTESFVSAIEPNIVEMRVAPSYDVKYRNSEHIEISPVFDRNKENNEAVKKQNKTTREIALSPILIDNKYCRTSSTSPIKTHEKVDRSCQYSPPVRHDLGLQCHVDNLTSSTQVSSCDIPNFLITYDGTQTVNDSNPPFDGSDIHTHVQMISPSLSIASSENQPATQPFALSGSEFIKRINEQRAPASSLTVTQYTNENYYLPVNDNNQTTANTRPTTLERSADSGILVDERV